jgi:hypothetical protein
MSSRVGGNMDLKGLATPIVGQIPEYGMQGVSGDNGWGIYVQNMGHLGINMGNGFTFGGPANPNGVSFTPNWGVVNAGRAAAAAAHESDGQNLTYALTYHINATLSLTPLIDYTVSAGIYYDSEMNGNGLFWSYGPSNGVDVSFTLNVGVVAGDYKMLQSQFSNINYGAFEYALSQNFNPATNERQGISIGIGPELSLPISFSHSVTNTGGTEPIPYRSFNLYVNPFNPPGG